nr:MAG TPA: hypothetical protein [Bacteriophage sp.]
MRFRGNANNSYCAPRYLNANNAVSNANVNNGGSAQRRASRNDAELIYGNTTLAQEKQKISKTRDVSVAR